MEQMGIRELKKSASAVMRRVVAGESIEVTDNGHPVARLVPVRRTPLEQLVADGLATEPQADLFELMERFHLPLPADPGEPLPSEILAELRADER